VFDDTGRWLGGVDVPARFFVFDITADALIGRWSPPDDVQTVRVYRLAR
jgi:hypothetical protein